MKNHGDIRALRYVVNILCKAETDMENKIKKEKEKQENRGNVLFKIKGNDVCNEEDLNDLWRYDVITSESVFERYRTKLELALNTKEGETEMLWQSHALQVIQNLKENLQYEIFDLNKEKENQKKDNA